MLHMSAASGNPLRTSRGDRRAGALSRRPARADTQAVLLTLASSGSSISSVDRVEPAASGRAKCRGCGRPIAKGELRFGEAAENPYGDGEATLWFHLGCGACMRPEKVGPLLDAAPLSGDESSRLRALTAAGLSHPRLVRIARAERASSGRAHCRHCRQTIEKDALRIALQLLENSRMVPIGTIHAGCSDGYFGTRETVIDRVLMTTPSIETAVLEELGAEVQRESRAAAPREEPPEPDAGGAPPLTTPGLAKAAPSERAAQPEASPERKSG